MCQFSNYLATKLESKWTEVSDVRKLNRCYGVGIVSGSLRSSNLKLLSPTSFFHRPYVSVDPFRLVDSFFN